MYGCYVLKYIIITLKADELVISLSRVVDLQRNGISFSLLFFYMFAEVLIGCMLGLCASVVLGLILVTRTWLYRTFFWIIRDRWKALIVLAYVLQIACYFHSKNKASKSSSYCVNGNMLIHLLYLVHSLPIILCLIRQIVCFYRQIKMLTSIEYQRLLHIYNEKLVKSICTI